MDRSSPRRGRRVLALCLVFACCSRRSWARWAADCSRRPPRQRRRPVWVATATGPGGTAAAGRVVARDPASGAALHGRHRACLGQGQRDHGRQVQRRRRAAVERRSITARRRRPPDGGRRRGRQGRRLRRAVRGERYDGRGGDWAVLELRARAARGSGPRRSPAHGHGNDVPSRLALSPTGAVYAAGGLIAAHHGLEAAVVKLTAGRQGRLEALGRRPGVRADQFSALGLDGAGACSARAQGPATTGRAADCLIAAFRRPAGGSGPPPGAGRRICRTASATSRSRRPARPTRSAGSARSRARGR